MLSVSLIVPYKIYGGAEKAAMNLASALKEEGFLVNIIALPKFFKKIDRGNVLLRMLFLKILIILKSKKIDKSDRVIVLGEYGVLLPGSIVWFHGSYEGYFRASKIQTGIFKRVLIYLQKRAALTAKDVVFVSEYLASFYGNVKGKVIWNINSVEPVDIADQGGEKILWIYGNSNPEEKGLSVIKELIEDNYNVLPIGSRVIESVNSQPRFYDHLELMTLIRSARLVLMPSLFEANSMILREAWSLGTPVLTSKVGIFRELVSLGLGEYVVDCYDSQSWKERINKIWRKSWSEIETEKNVLENFSTKKTIINDWIRLLTKE